MPEPLSEQTALLHAQRAAGKEQILFDDVVTLNYKNFGYVWVQCSFWWLLGLSAHVAGAAYPERAGEISGVAPWLVLVGTVWGVVGSALVLRGILTHTAIMLDSSLHRLQAQGVNVSRTHIAYSSFPLMRLLLCLVGASIGLLLLVFASEMLCVFRCSRGAAGVVGSMLPTLILVAAGALFLSCLRNVSPALPLLIVVVVTEVTFLLIKFNDHEAISWPVVFCPYWLFLLICAFEILRTLTRKLLGHISLSAFHISQLLVMAFAVYIGAESSLQISDILIYSSVDSVDMSTQHVSDNNVGGSISLADPWLEWLASAWLLYLSFAATGLTKWVEYANRRGYMLPLNVERTTLGWEPVPDRREQRPAVFIV